MKIAIILTLFISASSFASECKVFIKNNTIYAGGYHYYAEKREDNEREALKKKLIRKGYKITNNPSDADMIVARIETSSYTAVISIEKTSNSERIDYIGQSFSSLFNTSSVSAVKAASKEIPECI